MKFLCGNCKAKYQIADEKASGRTLRMKCRRCGHDILIDGHSMPAGHVPAPPAMSGSRRSGGSSVSALPAGAARSGSGVGPLPGRPPAVPAPARAASRSKPPAASLSQDFRRHVAAPPEVPQRTAPYDLWHVAIQDVPVGPMTRDELARKIDAGAVSSESLCWREGMDDWRPLGELPELSQLLRRPRDARGSSQRPPRPRVPPAVPAPTRPSMFPITDDADYDEDGSEPTRIADMTGNQAALSAGAASAALGSASQPKLAAVPKPVPQAASLVAEPAVAPAPAAAAPTRASRQGVYMGLAVGLLGGILLVGGPMLFRQAWSTTPQPAAPTATAAVTPVPGAEPNLAARDVQLDVADVEGDPNARKGEAGKPTKPGTGTVRPKDSATVATTAKPNDGLTDEQRKLLERMGGGGGPDLDKFAKPKDTQSSGGGARGDLTADQVRSVVKTNQPQLQRCYESAMRKAGGATDTTKITVNAEVGASGIVKSVSIDGAGIADMNDCIRGVVKRWRFPASGSDSPVAFPVVFQPGG